MHRWVTRELKNVRDDLLLSKDGLLADIADRARLTRFLHDPPPGDPHRWAQQVWILLSLASWDWFVNRSTPAWSMDALQIS